MTSPVSPPSAPTVPPYPALGSPTFNADAYTFGSTMPAVVAGIDALAENAFTNATSANESAVAAQASASDSDSSASVAMASANFKGEWSGLSGALPKPASVANDGRFWLLLNDLADVTTAVPGVSASWLAFDILLQVIPVNTSTVTLVSGKEYSFDYLGGPITATMPAPVLGAAVVLDIANKRYDNVLLHNGGYFEDETVLDNVTVNELGRRALRHTNNSWRGLR